MERLVELNGSFQISGYSLNVLYENDCRVEVELISYPMPYERAKILYETVRMIGFEEIKIVIRIDDNGGK